MYVCVFKLLILAGMMVVVITCLALCSVLYIPLSCSPDSNSRRVGVQISKPWGVLKPALITWLRAERG